MSRIPQEVLDDIRHQVNIVDVVGQYVQLKKSGKNYFGLCPFHDEKSPSFSVAEDKQIFHCFGCGKGGNVFQFLQEVDGLSFVESVEKVAQTSHVEINYQFQPEMSVNETGQKRKIDTLIEMHEKAATLFQHVLLKTKVGEPALEYLYQRGLTDEQIEHFGIGFAPSENSLLRKVFENEGYSEELLEASGLMSLRDNGEFVDRFFGRIMFPIRNNQGKLVAFSGRLFDQYLLDQKKSPKYLNSPETEIFNKRQVLYNFYEARKTGRKENELVLFEGFMDVIAAHNAGITNGVASMGTSLTGEQINTLQRTVGQLLICYDGDNAGKEASFRALKTISEQSALDISLVLLPEKMDPDEFIQKYGSERFIHLLRNQRESPFTFKLDYYKQNKNLENEHDRFDYLNTMVTELLSVNSVIEREVYIKQLADNFDVSVEAIQAEIQKGLSNQTQERQSKRRDVYQPEIVIPQVQQVSKMSLAEKTEQMLMYRILHESSTASMIKNIPDFNFIHEEYQEIFQIYSEYKMLHDEFLEADFLNALTDERLKNKLIQISYLDMSEESSQQEINDYIRTINKANLEQLKQEKLMQQKEASRIGNKELELQLTIEIINIQKLLKD
ncbi:DNA primase [Vagococcus xieshaowenii]|uniref:DNA primase n=1 Tax=Vagococcus xieshaowenii TaxID=2562451 RepID=A0AAJ5EEP4_9ENTE|nr:DNA primase [Vagococcus xieshaowenii]QCA28629.1 DNA primase [Vagococcus xieshaowenii]TFZ40563.1 DNA primase [Vagococcus xieshaowenii]